MRNDIKVIIYASDASQGSWRAFDIAINQAIKNQAEIVFVHAIESVNTITSDASYSYLPQVIEKIHSSQRKEETASKIRERILRFALVKFSDLGTPPKFSISIEFGPPEEVIIRIAERKKAELIIMGNRKSSAFSRMFLGSTVSKVLQTTSTPVLIVPLSSGPEARKKLATI